MSSKSNKKNREELLLQLETAIRKMGSQGILLSQAIAGLTGLNSSDMECLEIILQRNGVTAGELAKSTGLTTGAITGVVDRLEKAGYARRSADSADRRKVIVRAYPEKVQEIEALYAPIRQAMRELWAEYSDEELTLILDFAERSYAVSMAEVEKLRRGK